MKLKYINISVIALLILVFSTTNILAASLNISNPSSDETVVLQNQKLNVSFEVSQTVNPTIKYELNLKDSLCKEQLDLISSSSNPVKPGKYTAQLDLKKLELKTYCLNLCIYDLSEKECYNRIFTVSDTLNVAVSDEKDDLTSNKAPKITSYPSKLNLNYRENFFYQINAEDPNGDAFTYRLISAPDFIYLNQKTGTITNTNLMRPGNYFVAFVVIDRNGEYTQQNFTINVFEKYDSDGKPVEPTPVVNPEDQKVFEISKPRDGELVAGTNNLIQWNVKNIDYDKVNIYYQKIGSQWTLLSSIEDMNKKEYEWDVTGLTNGQYKIKLELKKGTGTVDSKEIDNIVVGNEINSTSLLILNLKPSNQSETDQTKPEISANVIPSDGGKVDLDKVEVWLDGKKITDKCSITEKEIKCTLESELSLKEHTVKMKVVDSNDQEVQQQWSFTVVEEKPDPTATPDPSASEQPDVSPTPDDNDNSGTNWITQITDRARAVDSNTWFLCCGGLILLLAGFFVVRFLRNRNAGSYYSRTSPEETTEAELASVIPASHSEREGSASGELEDFTDYSVGDYSVGDNYEPIVPSTQTEGSSSVGTTQGQQQSSDTSQTSDAGISTPNFGAADSEILPDWLKGDSDESSKPVNPDGLIMEDNSSGMSLSDGAKVHDDFGLTDDNSGDEDKSKKA